MPDPTDRVVTFHNADGTTQSAVVTRQWAATSLDLVLADGTVVLGSCHIDPSIGQLQGWTET